MKIRNNNPLDLEGSDGEEIHVRVTAFDTVHAMNYNLDGKGAPLPAGSILTFRLNKAQHDPSILVLFFTFSGSGGRYEITVDGSAGGDVSHYTVAQFRDEATEAIAYTFDVV